MSFSFFLRDFYSPYYGKEMQKSSLSLDLMWRVTVQLYRYFQIIKEVMTL